MHDAIPDDLMALAGEDAPQVVPSDQPVLSRLGVDMSRMLTFDFETGPDTERLGQLSLPGLVRTPVDQCPAIEQFLADNKTVKDVAAALNDLMPHADWLYSLKEAEEATEKPRKGVLGAIDEMLEKEAALLKVLCTTPRYAKITAFGWAIGNGEAQSKVVSHIEQPALDCSEAEALELFWDLVEQCHPLVGFNVKIFDIPLALTRSAILGVRPTRRIKLSKYSNNDVIDLFSDQGLMKGTCKDICQDFGIEIPAGQMDGSAAWAAYSVNPESLRAYVKSDVQVERELFWKLSGYFWD